MNSPAVKVRPSDKIRLSKIDPDNTGKMTKEEACAALSPGAARRPAEIREDSFARSNFSEGG